MDARSRTERWVARLSATGCLLVMVCALWYGWKLEQRKPENRGHSNPTIERYRAIEAAVAAGVTAVPALIADLDSSDLRVREDAMLALCRIGPEASAAIPRLLLCLAEQRPDTRQNATSTLARIGAASPEVLVRVAGMLGDSSSAVRNTTSDALVRIGPDCGPALQPLLIQADPELRRHALDTLLRISRISRIDSQTTAVVHQCLDDPDPGVHRRVFELLVRSYAVGTGDVVAELRRNDEKTLWLALSAVRRLTDGAAEIVPELLRLLDDERVAVRVAAARAAGDLGSGATPVVPRLVHLLHDQVSAIRIAAAEALRAITPSRPEAIEVLRQQLWDDDPSACYVVARTLVHLDPAAADDALPELRRRLNRTGDPRQKRLAIAAAHGMGVAARAALPDLIAALDDPDPLVQGLAAEALETFGADARAAVPRLTTLLEHRAVSEKAARALGWIGPPAESAVPELLQLSLAVKRDQRQELFGIPGNDDRVAAAAIEALGRIGVSTPNITSRLLLAVSESSPAVRSAALAALVELEPESRFLPDVLSRLIIDSDPNVRARAAWATSRVDVETPFAVRLLRGALDDASPFTRTLAVRSLAELGPPAAEAVPRLREMLGEPVQALMNVDAPRDAQSTSILPDFLADIRYVSVHETVEEALPRIETASIEPASRVGSVRP